MQRSHIALLAGLVLVALGLAIEGLGIFPRTLQHLVEDLTVDLTIHLFIAGWLLLAYGLFRLSRKERGADKGARATK